MDEPRSDSTATDDAGVAERGGGSIARARVRVGTTGDAEPPCGATGGIAGVDGREDDAWELDFPEGLEEVGLELDVLVWPGARRSCPRVPVRG